MDQQDTNQQSPQAHKPAIPEDVLLIVPVRNIVVFPGAVTQIALGRDISINAAAEVVNDGHKLGIVLQRDPEVDVPGPEDLYQIGTTVSVVRYLKAPNGMHHLICQGEQRFRVLDYLSGLPFLAARFDLIAERETKDPAAVEARSAVLKQKAAEAIELMPQAPPELGSALRQVDSPSALADLIAGLIDIKPSEKQEILETLDVNRRLQRVTELLSHRVEVLRLSREIGEQTQEKLDARQREYLLREQLRTIKKELGEDSEDTEAEELRKAIEEAQMPEEAHEQATKELRRFEAMPEAAAERSMVRTYLDWLVAVPWAKLDSESIDIARAREILDEDHYGLAKIKRRILEYLAVRKLNPEGRSPILCFVGPPGVGKTSLGQSIARAIGLKFVRSSLGGVHDEAEIRGHRRTYIGSMPGTIIQSIRKAGTRNPVMMLDEMDKLGVGFHGDPSSALLEVLDPEQNSTFRDHYLDVPFDLSKVLFIGTANVLDTIPGPLRDRMEIIELAGYTQVEKLEIAKRYLVQRQLKANGLKPAQASISERALKAIIDGYTREAGVRNLEREIGSVLRHAAMRITEQAVTEVPVDAEDIAGILGPPRFESEVKMRTSVPGVATGLAVTPVGGDILFVEASLTPGKGNLILTGQLGDVMKESAQAAVTLAKGRLKALGVPQSLLEQNDLHIHVPAGAIPKDGPSAGVAMFLAVASLLSGKSVRPDIAMTGEISLRGLVLPIGGVKEKTLAALRAGIKCVMLPARNKKDFEEIPEQAREQLEFVWLEKVEDALEVALQDSPQEARGQEYTGGLKRGSAAASP
ncbi:MAG TPA: endopeptidase La [Gammaproteobacteria bacterium]|nr:endopeptidase La [Gammaproteobacteria bacterium]